MTRWILAFGLLSPALALAERPLTYRDVLQGALEAEPGLMAASASYLQSEASFLAAQGRWDPTLNLDASYGRRNNKDFFNGFPYSSNSDFWNSKIELTGQLPTGTTYTLDSSVNRNLSTFLTDFGVGGNQEQVQDAFRAGMNVSITQQLLKGHRLSYNLSAITRARQQRSQDELRLEQARQQALANAAQAYWNWSYQQSRVQISSDEVTAAKEALRVGRLRLEEGELAPLDVTRLEASAVQAEQTLLDARLSARETADQVLLLMGRRPGEDVLPASRPEDVPVIQVDLDAALDVAMEQNLDVLLSRLQHQGTEQDAKDARHAMLPSLSVTGQAGLGTQDTTDRSDNPSLGYAVGALFTDEAFPNASVSGRLSVPLGNRAARGERDRAAAATQSQERAVLEQERRTQSEVAKQVAQIRASEKRIALADANLRLARQTLEAEEALSQAGRKIDRDLLDARKEVSRTAAEAEKARTDYRYAVVELQRLLGVLVVE